MRLRTVVMGVLSGLCVLAACGEGNLEGPPEDFDATAADFECLQEWTQVGVFRITNRLGYLDEAVALAQNQAAGQQYPVGTILQIFPTEAMVKRGPDFDPVNHNWEYFELDVSAEGTTIRKRGRDDVINRFGDQCFGCHVAARDFDFICGDTHGCVQLQIPDPLILLSQQLDPRCPTPVP